ncbi:MAG TPA: RidA family protein [Gemmatimonadales bacterium]|nr:RidA family protein [Gemmatimonadales bacterium]
MRTIATPDAPRAIGPYSQAMLTGGQVFTAGQIALDPASMELVPGGVAEQTERVMQNLRAILEAAGSGMSSVIKTTVYLIDMGDFAAMNEVYARHFGDHRPARSTVAVAALPKGARVEIDAIGIREKD